MTITLLKTNDGVLVANKNFTTVATISANITDGFDKSSPSFILSRDYNNTDINYFRVGNRYYEVTDTVKDSGQIIAVYGTIDVLTTAYYNGLSEQEFTFERGETTFNNFTDSDVPVENGALVRVYKSSLSPFNSPPDGYCYIMNVVGGENNAN